MSQISYAKIDQRRATSENPHSQYKDGYSYLESPERKENQVRGRRDEENILNDKIDLRAVGLEMDEICLT